MDIPLDIVFHNMPSSATVETDIRNRVGKLDRLYEHLIGCRVSVELLHRRLHTGNLYDVHIDMHVPGDELVVTREPHHPREKFADPDLGTALRNAFKAAERLGTLCCRDQRRSGAGAGTEISDAERSAYPAAERANR
jgi:ribosome-associated translation inhibitor RaiA